jgi:thiamine pyrophosphokinase
MRALVIADGAVPDGALMDAVWPGWRDRVDLVVAADGGAVGARTLGLVPDLVVGDGDSLGEAGLARLRSEGIRIELAPADKDESDTELAIRTCLARGAESITVVGGFGGRLDHTLANIWLLALPDVAECAVSLLDESTRVTLVRAMRSEPPVHRPLSGRARDIVSLIPLGAVEGVTTEGLRYPLNDEPLLPGPSRGLSNVRERDEAAVTIRHGLLLVVETPATL